MTVARTAPQGANRPTTSLGRTYPARPADTARRRWPTAVLLAALLAAAPAAAQNLYCCSDSQGRKVCGDRLPQQCIGKPHTIRGPGGKITKVEGFVGADERRAREAEEAKRKETEEAAAEERRRDRALLATYGSARDIDAARARSEAAVQQAIEQAEKQIEAAQRRRAKLETEAEFYKKKPVPAEIKRGLRDTDNEIKTQNELIEAKRQELVSLQARYDEEKARYLRLTSRTRAERLER
jgi:hypothetical protein